MEQPSHPEVLEDKQWFGLRVTADLTVTVYRQKMTQLYSQQVDAALQQWETEAQRRDEQEEQLNVSPLMLMSLEERLLTGQVTL